MDYYWKKYTESEQLNTEQFRKKINVNEPFNANFKLINNPVFRKAMENVEKHKDI